jgi:hypothetical protein
MTSMKLELLLALSLCAVPVAAQEAQTAATVNDDLPARWGLATSIDFGSAGGDFGKALRSPLAADINVFRAKGAWRYGLGLSFTSLTMEDPYAEEDEWGFQRTYIFATRMLKTEGRVLPYVKAQVGLARLHPRSELFAFSPPPEEKGDSPTHPSNGFTLGLVPGVEVRLNRSLALDLGFEASYFSVDEYDLSPIQQQNASSGTIFGGRLGVRWHPDDGSASGISGVGASNRYRDAWGVSRNVGWAIGETLAINMASSGINEYVRNANFNQISPRSWWANFEHGFTYDDNEFKTNQYIHPWNGAAYFNSSRSNGLGYWASAAFAVGGAFFWECCGETHPMSYNDMISTGIGGMALGEIEYRMSSQLLNNKDTGKSRFFREAGAMLIDPVRGFNRILSGRAKNEHENPEEPLDWHPDAARFYVSFGARTIGEGESISENTKSYAYVGLDHTFGSVFDNERRKPFDSFTLGAQLSFSEKTPLSIARIRGDLASWAIGGKDGEPSNQAISIVQHFDYHNNTAYEFGQQGIGVSWFSRYPLGKTLSLRTRFDALGSILAAVNADYSFLADVANRERYREYDYGPGVGAAGEVTLQGSGRPYLTAFYRFQWIDVKNGSVWNSDDERGLIGSDASHVLQAAGLRAFAPIKGTLGLGADGFVFLRKSTYSASILKDQDQRNPEVRVYLALNLGK